MSSQTDRFPAHVRAFSELLIKLRAELGNDLDMVLILAVIAERYYAAIPQPGTPDRSPPDPETNCEAPSINALSVALYTGIPRETVRRKIGMLVKKGLVECDARGNLTPTPQAAKDLASGTSATLNYLRAVMQHDQP